MENLGEEMAGPVKDPKLKGEKAKADDMVKLEDLDGLQMLRLVSQQEEEKLPVWKDADDAAALARAVAAPEHEAPAAKSSDPASAGVDRKPKPAEGGGSTHEVKCLQVAKPVVGKEAGPFAVEPEPDAATTGADPAGAAVDVDRKPTPAPPKEGEGKSEDAAAEQKVRGGGRRAKPDGVDDAAAADRKPALVKEVGELQGLTERQQKILHDFHVKFLLERADDDDADKETRVTKHPEFEELKKRFEEEEKMYASCTLPQDGEECDVDAVDPDSVTPSEIATKTEKPPAEAVTVTFRKSAPQMGTTAEFLAEGVYPARPAAGSTVARETVHESMTEVINALTDVAICGPDLSPRAGSRNRKDAMKEVADDDGFAELQEYARRKGSTGCHCCCRKAGKQIEEGGDEGDVFMTHSTYSVLNVVCPISGKPIVDLDDPVRSEDCEHIYDRASALNYLASMEKEGFCVCAAAGCRALLTEKKLVSDRRLWQDIDELRQINTAVWESRMLQDFVNIEDSDDD